MLLNEIISERWTKGHLTRNQLTRTVKQFVGNSGTIIFDLTDEERKRTNNAFLKIDIYLHEFLKRFAGEKVVEKIMSNIYQIKKLEKQSDDLHSSQWYNDISKQLQQLFAQETELRKYTQAIFERTFTKAIDKLRSVVPQGWIATGMFEHLTYTDVPAGKMEIFLKRDFTQKMEKNHVYYHATKLSNLSSIQKQGLVPSKNKRMHFEGWRNRTYLSTIYPDPEFVGLLMGASIFGGDDEWNNIDIALLKIIVPDDIVTYKDEEMSNAVFIEQPIPPENISVVYTGPVTHMPSTPNLHD